LAAEKPSPVGLGPSLGMVPPRAAALPEIIAASFRPMCGAAG
jgi:hypothetical protein